MTKKHLLIGLFAALTLLAGAGFVLETEPDAVWAQATETQALQSTVGTAFTYQGRLTDDQGEPLTGAYDFEFRLYDSSGGSGQIGSTITVNDEQLDGGRFTVSLDFGAGALTGDARWLEIAVREGSSTGSYATLTPRQALTPAPYALALPGLTTDPSATVPNVIGGYGGNSIDGGVSGATIGGGGGSGEANQVTGDHGTIGGGSLNTAGTRGTVGGGQNNTAVANATVGGGLGNDATDQGATVGGGQDNAAATLYGTVGGGLHNRVIAYGGTIAGGAPSNVSDAIGTRNRVVDQYGTVSGGGNNLAGSEDGVQNNALWATVGGGQDNAATADGATVGGGTFNRAQGYRAAVAGGSTNYASAQYATVGGGFSNSAADNRATVGGGDQNVASGPYATVAGGRNNLAGMDYHATVGGGVDNQATGSEATVSGGNDNVAAGTASSVPGGFDNEASGNYSLAAGYRAKAQHSGSFVWADNVKADFASTADGQFLIRANGGVGIGTNSPGDSQLYVQGSNCCTDAVVDNHVAVVENESTNVAADVLALKVNNDTPNTGINFITFFDSGGVVGEIEGDGAGGISLDSASSDFAERLPKQNPNERLAPGDVVGLSGGHVSKRTADADRVMVVSTAPIVAGNRPPEGQAEAYATVAFIGQAPVKVRGRANAGDYLVPSGRADGTGIAVAPEAITLAQIDQIVGQALESTSDDSVASVNALVGLPREEILQMLLEVRDERIEQQTEQLEDLEERVAVLAAASADGTARVEDVGGFTMNSWALLGGLLLVGVLVWQHGGGKNR